MIIPPRHPKGDTPPILGGELRGVAHNRKKIMPNQPEEHQQQIQVKATDEMLQGHYANMVQVGHSGEEFVLDFMNVLPPTGQLVSRVIVSPSHYKRLTAAMQDNLKRYEEQFGTISLAVVPDQKIGFKTE